MLSKNSDLKQQLEKEQPEKMASILTKASECWLPPPKLSPSEWAESNIKIPAGNKIPGLIRFANAPYQREPLDMIINPKCHRITLMWGAQTGKELHVKTRILTTKGWSTMGELRPGDYVYGSDGKPTRVTYVSPIRDNSEQYEITFTDHTKIKACADHQWLVDYCNTKQKCKRDVVLTTKDMLARYRHKGRLSYCINNTKPLENAPKELPIDPYTLGVWLADGSADSGTITLNNADAPEILAAIPYAVKRVKPNSDNSKKYTFDGLFSDLKSCDLINQKHIPEVYFLSSKEQRLELLQGLMDGDGTAVGNTCELSLSNEWLARDAHTLINSLGIKASFRRREARLYGERKRDRYRMGFTTYQNTLVPFKLARYRDEFKPTKNDKRHHETFRRRIMDITPIESVPMRCISVDNANSTYLAGEQLIPTHNTQMINCGQAYFIAQRPCSQMMMQPSGGDVKTWLETKFNPMVESNEQLSELIAKPRGREGVNNQNMKSYPGGWMMLAYSGSPKTMRGRSAPKIWCDEVDGYERTVEGDAVDLLWQRAATFGDDRLLVETSTPTIKGASKVEASYEQGDMRRYYIPCPKCETMQTLKWGQVEWDKCETTGEHLPDTAKYRCEHCEHKITDGEKIAGLRRGEWRAEKPFRGHASYHLSELYSAFRKWSDIVVSFLEKKDHSLQTFVNVSLAETWEEQGETIEPHFLYMRREHYDHEIPDGALLLVAGVDVQDDRIEGEIIAYGTDSESWGVEYFVLHGNPANPVLWGQLYDRLIKPYHNSAGDKFHIAASAIDSGGHYTQQVYDFVKRHGGVHRWYAVKGANVPGAPIVKRGSTKKGNLFLVGVDTAKELVYSRLKLAEVGAGYCHFPMSYDEEYFEQLTAEKRVTKYTNGHPKQVWIKTRPRNEALDCRVYALAALTILNPVFSAIKQRRQELKDQKKAESIESEKATQEKELEQQGLETPKQRRARRVPRKQRGGFVNGWR